MENSIKQCLHDYYLDMRSYETDLKTNINKIWMLVEEDFGKAEKELIKDNHMDKLMFNNKKSCKNFSLIFYSHKHRLLYILIYNNILSHQLLR